MWNVSAIVTTYNRSAFLRICIASLEMQTRPPEEVIIADDGSDPEHVSVIEQLIRSSPLKIVHARQEHNGFRVAASRNNAVRRARGDYLFFTDGDAVLFPDVLEIHLAAAGRRRWVGGGFVRLTAQETQRVSEDLITSGRLEEAWPGWDDPRCAKLREKASNFRRRAFLSLLWPSERRFRKLHLVTIQASMPREAFELVNGFDESFQGWGAEDLDLGLRLQLAGIRGRTVRDSSRVVHLDHEPEPRAALSREYLDRPRHGKYRCENGLFREGPDRSSSSASPAPD